MNRRLIVVQRASIALQGLAYLVLIGVIWLDEWLDLPHLFFHAEPTPFRWQEAAFETAILLLVAFITATIIRSLIRRLEQALVYLPFCPACQRVRQDGRWTSLIDFLQSEEGDAIDYALCPTCQPAPTEPPVHHHAA